MGGNLAKTPLTAALYAGLLWLMHAVLPWSEGYRGVWKEFTMPAWGIGMLIACCLLASIGMAVAYSATRGGVMPSVMLFLTTAGTMWIAPSLPGLLLGEPTGVMSGSDVVFHLAGGCIATALFVVLLTMLWRAEPQASAQAQYKLRPLGLVIRMLILPVIFLVAYYLIWYFLLWRVEAVRVYYGEEGKLNFMAEIIDILIYKGSQVAVTLLKGFAYALFSLPLLLQLQGKRVLFIASNTLLYLMSGVFYLVPNPVMPDAVRMAHLMETSVLMLLYGVVSGLLLHTAFRKVAAAPVRKRSLDDDEQEADAPAPRPATAQR